jgi:1-acyl-sn-glycerol-3-phosphate acyltransferase
MASFLLAFLRGSVTFTLMVVSTVFWCIPLYSVALAKALVPHREFRRRCTRVLFAIAEIWSVFLCRIIDLTQAIEWDLAGLDDLRQDRSYLLSSNHQSWVDILVLQYVFTRRIPFPRYFAKRELLWLPLIGAALWALEFPLMKRYSKAFLKKHPELRGQDLETTRRACERYRGTPVTIINFVEGTRFTHRKHAAQRSPYRHLLRPRAGGVGFVLDAMGENFEALLDLTMVYPEGIRGMWGFLCGRIPRVIVRVRRRQIPAALLGGNYLENDAHREQIQSWIAALWQEKDALIANLLRSTGATEAGQSPAP